MKTRKKLLSLLFAGTLCLGTVSSVQAAELSSGPEITVNNTTVGFAGQEWIVIGDENGGVYPRSGHITLVQTKDYTGQMPYRTGSSSSFPNATSYSDSYSRRFWYVNNPDGMSAWTTPGEYAGSTLQLKMEEIADSFPEKEQAIITPRSFLGEGTYQTPSLDGISGPGLDNQMLWPLSEDEYTLIKDNPKTYYPNAAWLRSPFVKGGAVARTGGKGTMYAESVLGNHEVRCAMSLDVSSVLFTSSTLWMTGKSAASVGDGLIETKAPVDNVKFTIKSDSQTLTVQEQKAQTNDSLSFTYSGATTGANQYVSCILSDENGEVRYYGKLADSSNAPNGSITVPLSAVENGTYTLQIFSEEINDKEGNRYYTDFCSEPFTKTITISDGTETPAPPGQPDSPTETPTTPSDPADPANPADPADPADPVNPSKPSTSEQTAEVTSVSTKNTSDAANTAAVSPKTGVDSPATLWTSLMLAAGTVLIVITSMYKQKKKHTR
nr:hypothetical protein [uncultured Mediterraneibacter sp.]